MDWKNIQAGLFDELGKIAEISLNGLSPQTIMERSQPPPPMETPGLSKAQAILDRAQTIKTAARVKGHTIGVPQYGVLGRAPEGPPPTAFDKAKKIGVNAVGGMGVGKLLTDYATHVKNVKGGIPLKPSPRASLAGMTAGGVLGLANYARNAHREKQFAKTSSFTSPAEQLKASRQVGTIKQDIHQGPSIKAQIPLIGRKAVPGGVP